MKQNIGFVLIQASASTLSITLTTTRSYIISGPQNDVSPVEFFSSGVMLDLLPTKTISYWNNKITRDYRDGIWDVQATNELV